MPMSNKSSFPITGLSAIQGGPFAEYLCSLLENSEDGEEKTQFLQGLDRTGLEEVIINSINWILNFCIPINNSKHVIQREITSGL